MLCHSVSHGRWVTICLSWYILFIKYMKYTGRISYNICGAVLPENVEPPIQKSRKTEFSFLLKSFLVVPWVFIICYLMLHSLNYGLFIGCMQTSQAPWALSHDLAFRELYAYFQASLPHALDPSRGGNNLYGEGFPREAVRGETHVSQGSRTYFTIPMDFTYKTQIQR